MAEELGILVPLFAIVFGTMIPIVWIYRDQLTKQKLIEARNIKSGSLQDAEQAVDEFFALGG